MRRAACLLRNVYVRLNGSVLEETLCQDQFSLSPGAMPSMATRSMSRRWNYMRSPATQATRSKRGCWPSLSTPRREGTRHARAGQEGEVSDARFLFSKQLIVGRI